MAREFTLPDLGEGLTEGEISRWLVSEGQQIAEDDPLVEIQTDKATVEIPSPYGGVVLRIFVSEGEIVPVGTALVAVGDAGESLPAPPAAAEPVEPVVAQQEDHPREGRVAATPLVRRMAAELGLDLEAIEGTGQGGRVTEEDIRAAAPAGREGRREPLRGVRRVIADHMSRAHREIPAVTWVEECDFEGVALERLVASTVKACAEALAEFPELNARLEGDEIVYLDRYDIGVAVETDRGLVVPVVRGAEAMTVDEIHEEVGRLADAARAGMLEAAELRGSTFTVTSAGRHAGLFQTPLINHPEVAILSIGRIGPRAVVREGQVVVRTTGAIALTFDHRVVDGARAAQFGLAVIERLESGGPAS